MVSGALVVGGLHLVGAIMNGSNDGCQADDSRKGRDKHHD